MVMKDCFLIYTILNNQGQKLDRFADCWFLSREFFKINWILMRMET